MEKFQFDTENYGEIFFKLINPQKLNDLGISNPDNSRRDEIESIKSETAFETEKIGNYDYANACLSAIWLHHDFLDESHRISQNINNASASFWHGIMHRHEGDYWNSKYWFRQVGNHPIFSKLYAEIHHLLNSSGIPEAKILVKESSWDPFLFVDMVQKYSGSDTEVEVILKKVQQLEWQLLFDYCYKKAIKNT